jgi:hypothetical protein
MIVNRSNLITPAFFLYRDGLDWRVLGSKISIDISALTSQSIKGI